MGVNDDIFDQLVRHQIGLNRLAASIVADVTKVLNRYDKRIEAIISGIDQNTKPRAVQRALRDIRGVNKAAYESVGKELRKRMAAVAIHESAYQDKTLATALRREVTEQLGLKRPTKKRLSELVDGAPINGALLSEYVEGMEQGRWRRMRDAVRTQVAAGGPAVSDGIRRAIVGSSFSRYQDGALGLSRRSLDQAARTIEIGVVNNVRDEYLAGNDEVFAGEQWVAMLETNTCPTCGELDGTVFPIGEGPRPPIHPNCRCHMTPIVKDWEELGLSDLGPGTRESMNGEVPESMTYNEWLAKQSAEVQDEALGPSRGKLFRDEGLTVDRFVDSAGRKYTLDELARREGL